MKSFTKHDRLDHLGMAASIACAIHCAALPLAITALPLLGLEFLANSWVEIVMICLSLVVGVVSLRLSYPKHQKALPVLVLVLGFLLIGMGHFVFEEMEALMIPIGGITIAAAHLLNWRYSRSCKHQ